ncbi:DUF1292 domain-containing protein [Bacillaceae bacterium S4-13-58]
MEKIEVGEVFTIEEENGEENEVEVLAVVTLEGTDYVAVSFVEDLQGGEEDDIDVFFLKVDEEGDLDAVESEEEFEKVSEAFDAIMEEDEEE